LKKKLPLFLTQDLLNIQVWFNLTWIHPELRETDPELASLATKGTSFTEEEKNIVLDKQLEIMCRITPKYQELAGKGQIENVVSRGRDLTGTTLELRCCTVDARLMLYGGNTTIVDSILESVQSDKPGDRIENCNIVSGKLIDFAKPGKNCFSAEPQFVNPELLDHRLMPTSPCRGKASDGADLGVRYTPEMVEILKVALALRQQGLIKF